MEKGMEKEKKIIWNIYSDYSKIIFEGEYLNGINIW